MLDPSNRSHWSPAIRSISSAPPRSVISFARCVPSLVTFPLWSWSVPGVHADARSRGLLLLLAYPAEDGLQTVIPIVARALEHPLAGRLERNHQSPRDVPVPRCWYTSCSAQCRGRVQIAIALDSCGCSRVPHTRPTRCRERRRRLRIIEERFTEMAHVCQVALAGPTPTSWSTIFVRFKTRSGEAAVLRGLWRKENAN